jgi:hypothetical protein
MKLPDDIITLWRLSMDTMKSEEIRSKLLPRKPYHKPYVEQVRLRLDEAVLGSGCKSTALGGGIGLGAGSGNCLGVPCITNSGT